jgi:hypothetical protein
MYWVNINVLKIKLQTGQFKEIDAIPYIIADGILTCLAGLAGGYTSPLDLVTACIAITAIIYGTWHVFKKHNQNSESSFLTKYITLGWVVHWRCLLVLLPLIIIFTIPVAMLGNETWIHITSSMWVIIFYFVFYALLGKHISET